MAKIDGNEENSMESNWICEKLLELKEITIKTIECV